MRSIVVFLLVCAAAAAEIRTLNLRQAVDLALRQNPDLIMARLEAQKAEQQVRIARDPFIPKLFAGSGLAYSQGFPLSIEGSAPSIVQARAVASVFNRPQSYRLAQAKETARGAGIDTDSRREEIVLRTAELYLQAEHAARSAAYARRQTDSLANVAESIRLRVQEGRELPIEVKRAALNLARARQRAEILESEQSFAEASLAVVLGLESGDRVRPADGERLPPEMPASEDEAIRQAISSSGKLRRLESALVVKGLEIQEHKAARLPRLDLVAQYGLFARFNNFEDFFRKFQRHNGQLGLSIQIPLFVGTATDALASQAQSEVARLRLELANTRNQISLDTRRSIQEVQKAETAREVARLELDLARDQLSILLVQMEEGRATLRQVEDARFLENERWIGFYDAVHSLELARLDLLKQTGSLLAGLR